MKPLARFFLSPVGRTGRRLYWQFFVLPLSALAIAGIVYQRASGRLLPFELVLAASPFLLWFQGVVIGRRLQDIGITGWLAVVFILTPIALRGRPGARPDARPERRESFRTGSARNVRAP